MPSSLSLLLLPLAVDAFRVPWNPKQKNTYGFKKQSFKGFADRTPDVLADRHIALSPAEGVASRSSVFLRNMRQSRNKKLVKSRPLHARQAGVAPLQNLGGIEYLVEVKFGDQNLKMILDTGSADTWVATANFTCTDASDKPVADSTCRFGALWEGQPDSIVADEHFKIAYGDGEFATGKMGTKDITIAGITVPQQKAGFVDRTFWNGDKTSSGLVGLAYAGITSAYAGTDTKASSTRRPYDPLFTTMYKANLSPPSFSLALQRGAGGSIAFGGLPPGNFSSEFGTAKIQVLQGLSGGLSAGLSFYAITPDALAFQGSATSQKSQYIVDSGTTLLYADTATAKALNSLFSPKPTTQDGLYIVSCSAKAPAFSVKIGGVAFTIDARDLIVKDTSSGLCVSGVQDGGSGPYILGDVFMNNVVSVFDVGAGEMRLAQHIY